MTIHCCVLCDSTQGSLLLGISNITRFSSHSTVPVSVMQNKQGSDDDVICFVSFCFALLSFVLYCYVSLCFALFCVTMLCFALFCFVFLSLEDFTTSPVDTQHVTRSRSCRGGYFLVKDYWRCAAGWGRIFTTRLTIFFTFLVELLEWGRRFSGFWG